MGTTYKSGFTILETMLFLAITGVLIVSLLVGTGASLNIQRYRDSVTTLKSYLQSAYSDLTNVRNDRDNSWTCDSNGKITQNVTTTEERGQSNCVLIGRYITIVDGTITAMSVSGYPTTTVTGTDVEVVKNGYNLNVSSIDKEVSILEWGTKIAWPISGAEAQAAGSARSLAILLIRSPVSGTIYTFTSDDAPSIESTDSTTLKSMLVVGNKIPGQSARTICVDPVGLFANADMAVYIQAYAASQSAIETRSNDTIKSFGGTQQC
jgi:type II secretory pathway pseudopilin PulG